MPRVERSAKVSWEGNVARGTGLISAVTGAFSQLPFSLPTRVGRSEGKTSPEELLAAAHAGCLAMSIANELTNAGAPPARLDVETTVRLDEIEGKGHRIVASTSHVRGRIDGIDRPAWELAVEAGHQGCTFSALLRDAGADVDVNGELEGD